jgi:hypothetical protein
VPARNSLKFTLHVLFDLRLRVGLLNTFEGFRGDYEWPGEADFQESAHTLLRLHQTYDMNTFEVNAANCVT